MLGSFHEAFGLELNWAKSTDHWIAHTPPLLWLNILTCLWANDQSMATSLGTPFGIDLRTQDVDEVLQAKVPKKLTYWTFVQLSLADGAVIVNFVLLSTLWFFIVIWGGLV